MAIPKIIHYCWLSNEPYPENVQRCIASWKKFLPDYEIILWDSNRVNIKTNQWVEQAVEAKKYAFAADYIRLFALYNFGGIYLDSDVEVLKSFNDLLNLPYFIGRENSLKVIEAATIGAEPHCEWIGKVLKYYENRKFKINENLMDTKALSFILREQIEKEGHVQYINTLAAFDKTKTTIQVFSKDFFCPKNHRTGSLNITSNTYSIHQFNGSWFTPYQREYFRLFVEYSQKYGKYMAWILCTLYSIKVNITALGFFGTLKNFRQITFLEIKEKK